MHLARLAVTSLDVSWTSPKTWREFFWLADRQWSGPVGLAQTGWALVSRKGRMSFTFLLLATISVLALVTPVVMTRAYPVVTDHVVRSITTTNVSVFSLSAATDNRFSQAQRGFAYVLWSVGTSPTELYPRNAYAEVGVNSSDTSGAWFFTGDSQKSEITVSGIRVAGGCEAWIPTSVGPSAFVDLCKAELGAELNPDSPITRHIDYADSAGVFYTVITNASSCSDVGQATPFGRESPSTVLFRLWYESEGEPPREYIVRCNATAGPGIAYVDGANMTFSQFTYAAPNYDATTLSVANIPRDPIAAITRSDMLPFQQSAAFKRKRATRVDGITNLEKAMAPAMWDGIVTMSAELWLESSIQVDERGIQRLVTTGIRRNETAFPALIALLGLWFVGMAGTTAMLLRSTWTGSLDGYAVARIVQIQPLPASTPWFADLEDNKDMLEPFKMHKWRSSDEQT